jgi:CMP-N,N'-diacetyllegionaminic acid synthase
LLPGRKRHGEKAAPPGMKARCFKMHTIAIIPARGGSKGIPGKNIIDFCGHPLVAWTIACCRRCRTVNGIFVSTDDSEIAAVARRYGAEVVARPAELSTDTADSESALIHALDTAESSGRGPADAVLFLQATSPLREPAELDGALAKFAGEKLDSLLSVSDLKDKFIWHEVDGRLQSWNYDFHNRQRRQDLPGRARQYVETGSFYITKPKLLRETRNRLGGLIGVWPVPFWKSFEIDSVEDLRLCEQLMRSHHLDQRPPTVE